MTEQEYPGLYQRIVAVFVDSIILTIFVIITVDIFSYFETVTSVAKVIAFILIFFLYDPILTSFFAGTIGHKATGIRVKQANNPNKNIYFHIALIRYLIKASLGWISLLTVIGNSKKQAIHDLIVNSVVVYSEK